MRPVKSLKTLSIIYFCLTFIVSSLQGQEAKDYVVKLTTTVTESPPSISFSWNPIPGSNKIFIYRKSKEAKTWGDYIAMLPSGATGYTDNNVETGIEYEYRIRKLSEIGLQIVTYVIAGIKCKEVEYRGKIILLVDSTFTDVLKDELSGYETDLIGDGWDILRKDISRNASVKYVKGIVRDFYNSDPDSVKALFLIGHIPVTYSGCVTFDGHIEHYGAWPTDTYYGSMDETVWTDVSANCTTAYRTEKWNVPGDGKYDIAFLPTDEKTILQIGRVDMYNLPAFDESESDLLGNYFNKNHDFRHKKIDPKFQAIVDDNFGWRGGSPTALGAWRNFNALLNTTDVKEGDYFSDMKYDSYILSYGCGAGAGKEHYDHCTGVGETEDFASKSVKTVFTALQGSWFGDWDTPDNLMRGALASSGWVLTCCWTGFSNAYTFHLMGMGETTGYCVQKTQNTRGTYENSSNTKGIHINLLGDPALRMHIVCPVNSLQSAVTADSNILLAWKPADDNIIGYHVYKLDTLSNKYNKITDAPVTDIWFEDTIPVPGNNYYMVRTFKLSEVTSGSYYNLSQGIFDTISYMEQTPVPVSGIELSVNPVNIQPLKIYEPFTIDAAISPANATNKLLKWSVENMEGRGRFNVNGAIYPDKGGKIAIIAEALDGSNTSGRLEVTIDSIPDAAGTITGEEDICRDNTVKLYTVPVIRGASFYVWTLPNGVTDTSLANEIDYIADDEAVPGNISVKGINSYADGDESILSVTLKELPPAPEMTFEGGVLHSSAKSGNQWYLDYEMIEGATDSVYIPVEEGIYHVCVIENNCISPPSNKKNITPSVINETDFAKGTVIYPNPSSGQLTISFGKVRAQQATVKVFNLQGKLMYSEIFQNTARTSIDLTDIQKGMYIVNVITDEKIYYMKVVVK